MKALVTGGAGYIGSNLVDRLRREGYEVWVVDNLSQGKVQNIAHHLDDAHFHFINDTILNQSLMERVISHVDVIYHLAAVVGVKYVVQNPLQAIITNVRGTEIVLELAHKYWKKTLIASTSEIYGKSEQVPLAENSDRLLGPTSVDRWAYSDSKAIDEYFALAYHKLGLPVVVVRYFNSYGPRLDAKGYGSVIARFVNQAMRGEPITVYDDGKQTRSFTYVDDTIQGTFLASNCPEAAGRFFNIGSSQEISVVELAHKVKTLLGSPSPIVFVPYTQAFGNNFEETRRRLPDVRLAEQTFGFRATVPLDDGLRRTIAWFQETCGSGGSGGAAKP